MYLRYNCCNIPCEPWGVKEGGDTGYIRQSTGGFLSTSRELILFPDLVGEAVKIEDACMGD